MEFGLKGTSRVCRGRHGEVGIVEFGRQPNNPRSARDSTPSVAGSSCADRRRLARPDGFSGQQPPPTPPPSPLTKPRDKSPL